MILGAQTNLAWNLTSQYKEEERASIFFGTRYFLPPSTHRFCGRAHKAKRKISDRVAIHHRETVPHKSISVAPKLKADAINTAEAITEKQEERDRLMADSEKITPAPTTLASTPSEYTENNKSIPQGTGVETEKNKSRKYFHVATNTAAGGSGKSKEEYLQKKFRIYP